MFDFAHLISRRGNLAIKSSTSHTQHLADRTYEKYRVTGKGFSSEIYSHAPGSRHGYQKRGDSHLFLIGHVYTNSEHARITAEKQHKLDISGLFDLFEQHRSDLIRFIKGIFVIFVADERCFYYHAYVSRSGLIKLFYYHDAERILLSTSMASLLQNLPHAPVLDDVAVIQHGFFEYTLGTRTHFKGISILDNLSYLTVKDGTVKIVSHVSIAKKLVEGKALSWKETKNMLPGQFNQVMDTIVPDGPFNSAITAGYDSRTVLSYIVRHGYKDCRLFSWAADDRYYDVAVAKQLADLLSMNYTHIHLGDEMLSRFPFYASQHIYWTDGMGSINRTNQMYSHSILAEYSRELITGYFGSELLRPLHRLNVMMREVFMDLLLSDDRERLLESRFVGFSVSSGFRDEYLQKHRIGFFDSVMEHMKELDIEADSGVKVLHYLIRYGFWKFFGQEFHAQRIHTCMHSPYMDDDFIDFIIMSCLREVHRSTYKRDPLLLMRSQALYNPIIKHNCPKLMKIPTNRGFAPADFESIFYPLSVLIKFQLNRMRKRKEGVMGFIGYGWHKHAYKAFPDIAEGENHVFKSLNEDLLQDGLWFSLKKWLVESLG